MLVLYYRQCDYVLALQVGHDFVSSLLILIKLPLIKVTTDLETFCMKKN